MRHLLSKIIKPIIDISFGVAIFIVGLIYKYDSYRRYFVLEVIARIPYFSYLSCLHLYQSLGSHPAIKLMNLHYKETINEEYHLMIMESLGGNGKWYDRVFVRIFSIFYYCLNTTLYFVAPESAYYLMQKVEQEATISYAKLLEIREVELKNTKANGVQLEYFYSNEARMTPAPTNDTVTLFDVFESILRDEQTHVKDMSACEKMPSLYTKTVGEEL